MQYTVEAIGIVRSCFKEKFAIPRQPGLAPVAAGVIEMVPKYADPAAFAGLESASHIWVEFIFHAGFKGREAVTASWQPTVRPPRLGGNDRLGVFATRSPNRPNSMGLSVVALQGVSTEGGGVQLYISGHDLLDGTPVVDIKPYVPYVDRVDEALNTFADGEPVCLPVTFSAQAQVQLRQCLPEWHMAALIEQVLQQDPRPPYQKLDVERIYGTTLYDRNIQWRYLLSAAGAVEIYVEQVAEIN